MRKFLIATAALSLLGAGGAFAQSAQDTGAASGNASVSPGNGAPITSDTATGTPSTADSNPSNSSTMNQGPGTTDTGTPNPGQTTDQGAASMSPPPAGDTTPPPGGSDASMGSGSAMANGATETADTPTGQPPASYPPCTSRTQDRCVQTGRMAKETHHMRHHTMHKKMAAKATDTTAPAADTPPATTPQQ